VAGVSHRTLTFSPQYLHEHRDGILRDWPRIPLPNQRSTLEASAALGETLRTLIDPDSSAPGVTQGVVTSQLKAIGVLTRVDRKPLTPPDLTLSAGWGHRTDKGVIMPGAGRTSKRDYSTDEVSTIGEEALELLGAPLDLMLNDVAMWRAVPLNVWEYRIGGYQVVKKWLSYRDESVLGRPLTKDEAREITGMIRRVAAILLMTKQLNTNYFVSRDSSISWPLGS
jgi:hypothetical protein